MPLDCKCPGGERAAAALTGRAVGTVRVPPASQAQVVLARVRLEQRAPGDEPRLPAAAAQPSSQPSSPTPPSRASVDRRRCSRRPCESPEHSAARSTAVRPGKRPTWTVPRRGPPRSFRPAEHQTNRTLLQTPRTTTGAHNSPFRGDYYDRTAPNVTFEIFSERRGTFAHTIESIILPTGLH